MSVANSAQWCGQSVERVEDAALLSGRGRFISDRGHKPGTHLSASLVVGVTAGALKVPGNHPSPRTRPESGGSFDIKQPDPVGRCGDDRHLPETKSDA